MVHNFKAQWTSIAAQQGETGFDINNGYNIDGYVLQAVAKIQQDVIGGVSGTRIGLCVQGGVDARMNCSYVRWTGTDFLNPLS